MALVRGKFISPDEVIKQNIDPSTPEDLARKAYVDNAIANIDIFVNKDGDTMTRGLQIESTEYSPFGSLLNIRQQVTAETAAPLPNFIELNRNISADATALGYGLSWLRGNYGSAAPGALATAYLLDFNTNSLDSSDFEIIEANVNIQNINGYAGNLESYFYVGTLSSGFWETYTRLYINEISGSGLYGFDFGANVNLMPGNQQVTGYKFSLSIADKQLGKVSVVESYPQVNYTDAGDFIGIDIRPTITGTASDAIGLKIDMTNVSAANVVAIDAVGKIQTTGPVISTAEGMRATNNSYFNTVYFSSDPINDPAPSAYGYADYTEMGMYNDSTNTYVRLAFDGVLTYEPTIGRSFVGFGQIELKDSSNQPSIPAGDAYVATKKYVDDQVGATLKVPHKENFVLTNTDISNGYVDLTRLAIAESTVVNLGGIEQHEDDDYTVSTVGGISRITFIGPLLAAVVPGDKVYIRYWSLD